jgi:hypothetical protein
MITNDITTSLSYKLEIFLLLNGTIFNDVPHDDNFLLLILPFQHGLELIKLIKLL